MELQNLLDLDDSAVDSHCDYDDYDDDDDYCAMGNLEPEDSKILNVDYRTDDEENDDGDDDDDDDDDGLVDDFVDYNAAESLVEKILEDFHLPCS